MRLDSVHGAPNSRTEHGSPTFFLGDLVTYASAGKYKH